MEESSWLPGEDALENYWLLPETPCEDLQALTEPLFLDVVVEEVLPGPVLSPAASPETPVSLVEEEVTSNEENTNQGLGASRYSCSSCSKSFRYKSRLRRHLTTHQSKQYPCNRCEKYFSRQDVMEAHMRRTHFLCVRRQSPSQDGLRTHHRLPCPRCPAQLASPHHYRRHLQAHQKNSGSFQCQHCGKAFADGRKYRVHLKGHEALKKFECSLCGMRFAQQEFLRRHQRVHSGERPFPCQLCGAQFRQRVNLRQHEKRKHAETTESNKKEACSLCEKRFFTSSELKNHMLYHQSSSSANRAFACSSCPMTFIEKRHLDRHQRRVHVGIRQYVCPLSGCGKAFFEKYELNYHLKYLCHPRLANK